VLLCEDPSATQISVTIVLELIGVLPVPLSPIKTTLDVHGTRSVFACLLLVTLLAARPSTAMANARTELTAIKTHVQQIMDRCRTLKTSSRKRLTSLRETTTDAKESERLSQLQSRIPFVCNEVSASGYAILEYANRLSKQCLACLGGAGLCPPDQARRCQADSEALSDKNYDFALYQKNLVELIDTYNKAINQSGTDRTETRKNPKVRAVAKDKEVRKIRNRLAASVEKVKRQNAQCDRLRKEPRSSVALESACKKMQTQSTQFFKIAGQLNYQCLLCVRGGKCKSQKRFDACRAIWTQYAASEELMAQAHADVISSLPALAREIEKPSKKKPSDKPLDPSANIGSKKTDSKTTGSKKNLPTVRLKPTPRPKTGSTAKEAIVPKTSAPKPLDVTNLFSNGQTQPPAAHPKFGPGPWAHFGSFLNEYYARSLTTKLNAFKSHFANKQLRYDRELVKKKKRPDGVYYFRVRIGPFANRTEVNDFCRLILEVGQIETCKSGRPPKVN